jgi:hypothetical protein
MASTPHVTPTDTPRRRSDKRPTITLKGDRFDGEFRNLINKAAKRAGTTQSDWIADTLTTAAQRLLKGLPVESGEGAPTPPAVMTERLDETDKRLETLAKQVEQLTALQRRTLWQRLRGLVAPA